VPVSINGIRKGYKVSIRALFGMQGHRPSEFNRKVGACMKGTPGGRGNVAKMRKFVDCCRSAGAHIRSTRYG